MSTPKNVGASVRARLLNRAKTDGMDFNLILMKYALERLLYRLSISQWSDAFLLKGALLFDLWFDKPQRPTRDIDLLGFGPSDLDHAAMVFREVCVLANEDSMKFSPDSVRAMEIRKESNYAGIRVTLLGLLDGAQCAIQIDVGYGDAVTPEPHRVRYPVLLDDMSAPVLRVYPAYTVVAEKYHAMVSLGIANTRLKDYFDLWILSRHPSLNPVVLKDALAATFARRETLLPTSMPVGLSDTFARDPIKIQQWQSFLGKNNLHAPALDELIRELRKFLWD